MKNGNIYQSTRELLFKYSKVIFDNIEEKCDVYKKKNRFIT